MRQRQRECPLPSGKDVHKEALRVGEGEREGKKQRKDSVRGRRRSREEEA